ncbi:hypothetical protein ACFLYH_02150 [Candidatus Dependentiae bacterium]
MYRKTKNLFIFFIILIFTTSFVFSKKTKLTQEQTQQIHNFLIKMENFKQKSDAYLDNKDKFINKKSKFFDKIKDKLNKTDSFNDLIIFQIPMPNNNIIKNLQLNFGIYKSDLIEIPILLINSLIDNQFKETLWNFYIEKTFDAITRDNKNLISILSKINTKAPKKETDAQKLSDVNEAKDFVSRETKKKLENYIVKMSSNYSDIFKQFISKRFIYYLLYSEIFDFLKMKILVGKKQLSFTDYFKYPNKSTWIYFVTGKPIPLHNTLNLIFNPYLQCLSNNLSVFKYLLNEFVIDPCKYCEYKEPKTNTIVLKKYKLFKIWDSYPIHLLQEFLTFANAIKNIESSFLQKQLFKKIKNNPQHLALLLIKNKSLQKKPNPKELATNSIAIKDFIKSSFDDINLFQWLKIKKNTFYKSKLKTNLIFSIPSIILCSKLFLDKYKSSIYKEIKSLTKQK